MSEPARVLIVDDSATTRLKLSMATHRLGHEAVWAGDGLEAMEMLREGAVDLVLLDLEMPQLDGYGVLELMREDEALRDVPVIVVSGSTDGADVARAIGLGATDVLTKDFEPVLFRARVEACIYRKRLADQRALHVAEIERQRDRADALLAATLPAAAVAELIETGGVTPRRHEDVVVLFADVVAFTEFCDANPPEEAVSRLGAMVDGFERIATRYGLEKIKTTGDAFVATADLLLPNPSPVEAAAACALEIAAAAPVLTRGWQVRIGLHAGPVVAGVIGRQQHLFDLWGDTVNVAARIAALAPPGSVCVGPAVHDRLGEHVNLLGRFVVAGKGEMDAYHLVPGDGAE